MHRIHRLQSFLVREYETKGLKNYFPFTTGCSCVKYHGLNSDHTQLYTLYQILYSAAVLFCVKVGFALTSKFPRVHSQHL